MSNVHASDRKPSEPLQAAIETRDLAMYTIQITSNEKVFIPAYKTAMVDKLVGTAIDIHTACWAANNIRVQSKEELEARLHCQTEAVRHCNKMLALIDIAWKLYHLAGRRVQYWTRKTVNARNLIRAWKKSDMKRYAEYC